MGKKKEKKGRCSSWQCSQPTFGRRWFTLNTTCAASLKSPSHLSLVPTVSGGSLEKKVQNNSSECSWSGEALRRAGYNYLSWSSASTVLIWGTGKSWLCTRDPGRFERKCNNTSAFEYLGRCLREWMNPNYDLWGAWQETKQQDQEWRSIMAVYVAQRCLIKP